MPTNRQAALIPAEHIAHSILILRGQRVLLDSELAALYGVPTKRFNEQVKRNVARFLADFMFRLSTDEANALRSQFATLKAGRGRHRKYLSYAFNEQAPSWRRPSSSAIGYMTATLLAGRSSPPRVPP